MIRNDTEGKPECFGTKDDGRHQGIELKIIQSDGTYYWKCPECGWMMSRVGISGVSAEDYV